MQGITATTTITTTIVKTIAITSGVERAEEDFLPVLVLDMVNMAKSAVSEVMVKAVVQGSEGEVFLDLI